jgi:putative DNA primase/helicase
MGLWCLHAHAHDAGHISPLLAFSSPEKRCGKTTVLAVLQHLVPRPLTASNITSAALFRSVEKWQPSLLIDEADTFLRASDEMRGVINSGHTKNSAFVIRTAGDDHEPRRFRTWSPKAIALIGALPDTLEDRAVNIAMRRKRPDERTESFRLGESSNLEDLNRRCVRWASDTFARLAAADPDLPGALHDRAKDNWHPLVAIADAAGGDWPARARQAAVALSADDEDESSIRTMLLADIRDLFAERGEDRLTSSTIIEHLVGLENHPWPEFKNGKALTTRGLARLLKPFKIVPRTIRLPSDDTPKGYVLEDFHDAFSRYLPISIRHAATALNSKGNSEYRSATPTPPVADKNRLKPAENLVCGGVADRDGGPRSLAPILPVPDANCAHCNKPVVADDEIIPVAGGGELHGRCYQNWFDGLEPRGTS